MTTPTRNNLWGWARRFIDGPAVVCVEGDSIWSPNTPRLQYGVAKKWRPRRWVGWHNAGSSELFDASLNAASGDRTVTDTNVTVDGAWYGGQTVAPIDVRKMEWTGNEGDGSGIFRVVFNSTALGVFPDGDWTSNVAMKGKAIWWANPDSLPTATFRGRRSDDSTLNTNTGVAVTAGVAQYGSYEVDIPAGVNGVVGYPSMDIILTAGANETGKNWYPIAFRLYRSGVVGTEFNCLGSIGGADLAFHINPAVCSDAMRQQYYAAIGSPNLFIIPIGTNGTVAKADLLTLIQNRRAIMANLGVKPYFLLLPPYDTNRGAAYHQGVSQVMYELSCEHSDVAFIDQYQVAGPFATLDALYLSDSVHPTEAGAAYFAEVLWTQIAAAASETPSARNLRATRNTRGLR